MAAATVRATIAPEYLRLVLIAWGFANPFRVVNLYEVAQGLPDISRHDLEEGLEKLAEEGLVTKFVKRYCFNKPLPIAVRREVERQITSSGTLRIEDTSKNLAG